MNRPHKPHGLFQGTEALSIFCGRRYTKKVKRDLLIFCIYRRHNI